jgi:hypothetical protein
MQLQQKMMHTQMQRDGSIGDNRAQSPNSVENMGSPSKRPRTDGGNFNGQQGPAGRGQPMPSQQMGGMAGGPNGGMLLQNGISNEMSQQQMGAFSGSTPGAQQKTLEVLPATHSASILRLTNHPQAMTANGGPQGPMGQQGMEGFSTDMLNQQRMQNGGAAGATQGGNHALQDYRKHTQRNI